MCVTEKMYRALAVKEDCGFVSVFFSHVVYFFRLVNNVVILTNINHGQSLSAEIVKKKVKTRN